MNSKESERVKILIVDDHTLFSEGTASLLSFEPRILVVGIAKTGIECMNLIDKTRFDVVLLDIRLPDICGIDLIDKIKKVQPEVKMIMMTGYSSKGFVTKSMGKGANGFLLKDCSAKEMIEAILRVHYGSVYFSKGLKAFLPPENNSDKVHLFGESEMPSKQLTTREIKIIELIARGLHNKEIATALGINVRTVESHVCNILSKFGVSKRFEAVLYWANVNKETV